MLDVVISRCLLQPGAVLSFDELFGRKTLIDQEWKALEEARLLHGMGYEFATWMLHPQSSYGRVSVVVKNVTSCRFEV